MLYVNYISIKLGKTFLIKNKYKIKVFICFIFNFLVPFLRAHEFTLFQDGFAKKVRSEVRAFSLPTTQFGFYVLQIMVYRLPQNI